MPNPVLVVGRYDTCRCDVAGVARGTFNPKSLSSLYVPIRLFAVVDFSELAEYFC